eukprot:SAG22_NODE_357_length_11761_cov_2.572115_3_plen_179_part_00
MTLHWSSSVSSKALPFCCAPTRILSKTLPFLAVCLSSDTVDNTGPPTAEQVTTFWTDLQHTHPGAHIVASSLDDFASEVLAGELGELPVVTEELGDSWLYGAPADPQKVAMFREARRALNSAVAEGRVDTDGTLYDRYMRRLMKGKVHQPMKCSLVADARPGFDTHCVIQISALETDR